jgi:hypothetical protein
MPKLKPYRQYSEYDVVNGLFSYSGSVPVNAGTIVKITNNYRDYNGNISEYLELSDVENTMSALFSCVGSVEKTVNFDDTPRPIGILLKDVKSFDENGTPLIFEPRAAAERDIVLPHQAVPILTKGIILINDIDVSNHTGGGGSPAPGDAVYVGNNGSFATDGVIAVGQFLSTTDDDGYCLIRFSF